MNLETSSVICWMVAVVLETVDKSVIEERVLTIVSLRIILEFIYWFGKIPGGLCF